MGKRKGELKEILSELEELGYDYRYIRGISALLDRRCLLESKAATDPVKIRRKIFKIAHEHGFPVTSESRREILRCAASELGITMEELDGSLYGDLEDEFILKNFKPVEPEVLLKQYNLSLTQTLLFYSNELIFTATGNWQRIFRQIKRLGLIYTLWINDGKHEVRVDGPISLFKLNRRYGINLAKLFHTIVQSQGWSVKAEILHRKGEKRLLKLELDSQKDGGYMYTFDKVDEEPYDSLVEQDFARRFRILGTGWTLTREPEPIPVGKQVMIPDFSFRKGNMKVYMEIVGFWTPQYLQEKVKKLGLLSDVDMIVVADRALACHKFYSVEKRLNVIYYKRRIVLKPILAYLKTKEERLIREQTKHLKTEAFNIQKPIIEARELAEMLGVLEDAVKDVLREREIQEYTRLGDMLIKDSKLKEIQKKLEKRLDEGTLNLEEASKIIENAGGTRPTAILNALNYEIEWQGIDPRSVRVFRKHESFSRSDN